MTSDEVREAIEVLEVAKAEVEWNYLLDYAINIDLAIEALKKQIQTNILQEGVKMTNFEKFGKEIIVDLIKERGYGICGINKKNGKLMCCDNDDIEACEECVFNGECGSEENIRNWLNAEYQEVDWSKVPIDTKILVSDDKINWYRRYFAGIDRCTNERLAWLDGATSWANRSTRAWKHVKLYKEDE